MCLIFVEAIIIILKHASFLRFSDVSRHSVLSIAEKNYLQANMDFEIQQFLAEHSQEHLGEHSVGLFADFIMANDIGWLISYVS